MRKKLFSLSALLLGAAMMLPVSAAVADYDQVAALASARADVANWQSYLPDDVFVAHVSLPGTHDTATAHGWTTKSSGTGPSKSTTQAVSIDDQLAGGVRAFDFRPGIRDNKLNCNHGMDETKLYLDAAFDKLTAYLDAHPKEFFVIHLFRGNVYRSGELPSMGGILGGTEKVADQQKYNNLFNEFFNKGKYADYIVDYSPYLKVKDIRGKMVIFRRNRIDFAHVAKGGNLENWPGSEENWTENSITSVTHDTDPAITGIVRATDVSSPDNEEELQTELNSMANLFNYNLTLPVPNDAKRENLAYKPHWTMIFTSGAYNGEETAGYLRNAEYTNPHFTGILRDAQAAGKTGPAGTVFSDWVLVNTHKYSSKTYNTKGVDLIPAIYENNFHYIKDYILDDELFSASTAEKIWDEGKEYFMRNVETGMLLCGGQWWGTHATAGRYGIRVTPHFDINTGLYTVSTSISNNANLQGWYGENDFIDNTDAPQTFHVSRVNPGQYSFVTADGRTLVAEPVSGWLDGTPYTVYVTDNPDGKASLWELVSCDEYWNGLTQSASMTNPVDISNMGGLYRPNDHSANATWTFSPEAKAKAQCVRAGDSDNKMLIECSNPNKSGWGTWKAGWSFSKDFTGIPNGIYDVSFDYYADNIGNVTATVCGTASTLTQNVSTVANKTLSTDAKTAAEKMLAGAGTRFTQRVSVTDNKISVSFSTPSHSSPTAIFFDNFTLTYYGPDPEVSCAWLQKVIDDASAKVTKYDGAAEEWAAFIAPYQAAVTDHTLTGDGTREADEIYARLRAIMYERATEGADFTDAIVDNSFELGLGYGWSYNAKGDTGVKENSNKTYQAAGCDGALLFNTWDGDNWGSSVTQTISDLPVGRYRLEALVTSFKDSRLWLFVNNDHTSLVNPNEKTVFNSMQLEFDVTEEGIDVVFGAIAGTTDNIDDAGDRWYKADNFRLTYLGEYIPTLTWTMEGDTYDTIILPFDAECPDGLDLYETHPAHVNFTESGTVIGILPVEDRIIKAYTPYVVKSAGATARAAGQSYTFVGKPDANVADDLHFFGMLTGTIAGCEAGEGCHVMVHGNEGSWFTTMADYKAVSPLHAYIDTANYPENTYHADIYLERNPINGAVTGLDSLGAADPDPITDVYTLSGILVRTQQPASDALRGLAPGLYILRDANGTRKAVVR